MESAVKFVTKGALGRFSFLYLVEEGVVWEEVVSHHEDEALVDWGESFPVLEGKNKVYSGCGHTYNTLYVQGDRAW